MELHTNQSKKKKKGEKENSQIVIFRICMYQWSDSVPKCNNACEIKNSKQALWEPHFSVAESQKELYIILYIRWCSLIASDIVLVTYGCWFVGHFTTGQ